MGVCVAAVLAGAAVFKYAMERRTSKIAPAGLLVRSASRIALALLTAGLVIPQRAALYHVLASSRNFYAVFPVLSADAENYFALLYGDTVHGFQFHDHQRPPPPTPYYSPPSGA